MDYVLAGMRAIIFHQTLGFGLAGLLFALGIGSFFLMGVPFIGPLLGSVRSLLFGAAVVVTVILSYYNLGLHDERARCIAQSKVIERHVDDAVNKATTPDTGFKDPWDNPDN